MAQENSKIGYAYSVVLHLFVAASMFAYALVEMLFPKESQENKITFEMVEPSANPPEPPSPPASDKTPDLQPEKVEEIKPIDIPEPQPPEPTPPEPEPQPTPPPPEPKPEPKPAEKPKPQKKISIDDFKKKNPKRATNSEPKTQPRRPIKIGQISASTSNIDNIAQITPSRAASSSQAMQDALSEYTRAIYIIAKRNWKVPTISSDAISAKVMFRVSKTGIISGVKIVESSGDADFDSSIIQVLNAITIPPPPDNEPHTIYIVFKAL